MDHNTSDEIPRGGTYGCGCALAFMGSIRECLRGAAQVFFQERVATGLCFMLGIYWAAFSQGCPTLAIGATVALVVSYVMGYLLGLPRYEGKRGLWGYNGVLVGCALPLSMHPGGVLWVALVFGAIWSTWLRTGMNHALRPLRLTALTFPFVVITWIVLAAVRHTVVSFHPDVALSLLHIPIYVLKGLSQVFLIDSWETGLLLLVGLILSNWRAALWALIGSALGGLSAWLFGASAYDIAHGLYGYSPVLTAIALGAAGSSSTVRTALWTLLGIFVTFWVQAAMESCMRVVGLPVLTAPFCLATWIMQLPHFRFGTTHT